jgi:hypothetical protein
LIGRGEKRLKLSFRDARRCNTGPRRERGVQAARRICGVLGRAGAQRQHGLLIVLAARRGAGP